MANQVHLALFISRLVAPMAAKQEAHKRSKSMKMICASPVSANTRGIIRFLPFCAGAVWEPASGIKIASYC